MRDVVAHLAQVIRIDAVWLAIDPLDMRAGTDTALARVCRSLVPRVLITPTCSPIAAPPA